MFRRRRRITVTDSGAASTDSGYANSGVHVGDVNLRTGTPVRTRYHHQVRRIAPPDLEGRGDELAELAAFCISPETAGTYAWWRADAWSGKTALMSWFVLHPPEGVRVLSFFVTARFAGQNDRHACVENLMEQLLAVLGAEWPPGLGPSRYEPHLLGLLTEAAEAGARRGEHVVLLVDGLDEDRGVHAGPDSHSIAALLPATLPAGLRVVVTSRPHPPLPADVPPHHPLRDDTVVRTLTPSPRAQAIRVEMERDLTRLLAGGDTERDLLGLVTAAGGGLSADDLAELTGESPWQVRAHLRSVTGRSLAVHLRADGEDVYLLGHEEIHATALEVLGPARPAAYRERLHAWAERYRGEHWPAGTPEYLLHGYFGMLAAAGDTRRMVACATDPHRHDRVLDRTGGHAVTLSEITTTQDVLVAQAEPDLCALVRLAVHRDRIGHRTRDIPVELPAIWARLGHLDRAESIADSIAGSATQPIRRTRRTTALTSLAIAAAGDRARVARILDSAEQAARLIGEVGADSRAHALALVAGAAEEAGDHDRAVRIAGAIAAHPDAHGSALARMAGAAARAGDLDRAEDIVADLPHGPHAPVAVAEAFAAAGRADRAEELAGTIGHRYWRTKALARVAEAVAKAGDHDRAEHIVRTMPDLRRVRAGTLARVAGVVALAGDHDRAERLLGDAEEIARTLTKPHDLEDVRRQVAEALAMAGEFDRAERTADTIAYTHPPHRTETWTRVAEATARAGDADRAERIAGRIAYPPALSEALTLIAGVVADAGDSARATRLLHQAERLARDTTPDHTSMAVLARVAGVVAETGDLDRAERITDTITGAHWRAAALARVAGAVAEAGDTERAERLARTIDDAESHWKVEALALVAGAVATAGDLARAEGIARGLTESYHQETVLARVAEALAEAGDTEHAERLTDGDAGALSRVARATARAGDPERAERIAATLGGDPYWHARTLAAVAGHLLDEAERIARTYREQFPSNRVTVLVEVAEAVARAGEVARATRLLDDAERLAHTIDNTYSRARALTRVAEGIAEAGDADRAERLAHTITLDRQHRATALVAVARRCPPPRGNRVLADVLLLDDWHLAVDVLAELAPATGRGAPDRAHPMRSCARSSAPVRSRVATSRSRRSSVPAGTPPGPPREARRRRRPHLAVPSL